MHGANSVSQSPRLLWNKGRDGVLGRIRIMSELLQGKLTASQPRAGP